MASFTMVEFPTTSADRSAEFLSAVFGWPATVHGPHYRDAGLGDGRSLGFQSDETEQTAAPLVVIEVNDLEETRREVEAAGGAVTKEPFDFPGGRRFHFREPGGNELAAWVPRDA